MGPVISDGARQSILRLHRSRQEGRPAGGRRRRRADGDGYFIQPTVIADVDPKARIFQEEIFGPVLAVTKAKDFEHALRAGQRLRIRPDRRGVFQQSRASSSRRASGSSSATCTSTASAPARWSGRTRSAASICRARIRRRAARITCCCSCRRSRSRRRFSRPAPSTTACRPHL